MANIEGLVTIKEEAKGDVLVLRMSGRLDAVSSPTAERKVFDSINNDQRKLLFDFGGIDYLSSAGMRMLLSITKKLKSLSGKLVLFAVAPNVMDILKCPDSIMFWKSSKQKKMGCADSTMISIGLQLCDWWNLS